jgi:hypothetical protein
MHTNLPDLDAPLPQRLVNRFGKDVESWLDQLPPVLAELATRWKIQLGELIPRGHMSVVVKCLLLDGRPGVLKICPDRERLAKRPTPSKVAYRPCTFGRGGRCES